MQARLTEPRLGVAVIGRTLAQAKTIAVPPAVKRVDRFLGHARIDGKTPGHADRKRSGRVRDRGEVSGRCEGGPSAGWPVADADAAHLRNARALALDRPPPSRPYASVGSRGHPTARASSCSAFSGRHVAECQGRETGGETAAIAAPSPGPKATGGKSSATPNGKH
jgi:hypothetical protein